MREINYTLWTTRYLCFVCGAMGVRDAATIRVISGRYGGGWPACHAHEQAAIDKGLEPLSDPATSDTYTVTAFRVDVDQVDGGPKTGRRLWSATKRDRRQIPPHP